jgi:leader peptidase (prepilin peptidase)/N-methyltransferase
MSPLMATLVMPATIVTLWLVARRAAGVRGLEIGTLPAAAMLAATAVGAAATAYSGAGIAWIAALAAVTIAGVVDARTGFIFDPITATLAIVAILVALRCGNIGQALMGGTAVGGALLALYLATARRGLGLGDVKLATGIGSALGLQLGFVALAAAFVIGGTYGAWLLATRRAARGTSVRFGPFVAAGTYVAVLFPALHQ